MYSDVFAAFIAAKISFTRIVKFLDAPELEKRHSRNSCSDEDLVQYIFIKSPEISWDVDSSKAILRTIDLVVQPGQKLAVCGEVGSGKSTLLAAILGENHNINSIVSNFHLVLFLF